MLTTFPQFNFFTEISRNAQSKSYVPSLTQCVWEFQNMYCGILNNREVAKFAYEQKET